MRSTEWDGHVDDADSLDPEPDKQDVQSPLGLLLFGEKHAAAGAIAPAVRASIGGGAGPTEFDDDIFAPLDQQDHWSGHGHAAVGMINEASLAIDQGPWTFDVVDNHPLSRGAGYPLRPGVRMRIGSPDPRFRRHGGRSADHLHRPRNLAGACDRAGERHPGDARGRGQRNDAPTCQRRDVRHVAGRRRGVRPSPCGGSSGG
jgi:hypothetical protein